MASLASDQIHARRGSPASNHIAKSIRTINGSGDAEKTDNPNTAGRALAMRLMCCAMVVPRKRNAAGRHPIAQACGMQSAMHYGGF